MSDNLDDTFIEMINPRIIVSLSDEFGKSIDDILIPARDFVLKEHQEMPYLTLGDIYGQLKYKYGDKLIAIDVWYELGLSGYIYRYVKDSPYWVKHGSTRGYA